MEKTGAVEKLIRRCDHNYFAGYVVCAKRAGRSWTKHFSDKPDGAAAALRRARAFRDQLVAELTWPAKVKRRYVHNTSGTIGVTRTVERQRNGKWMARWVATWPTREGRTRKATFSVNRYGEAIARRRAVEARRQGLAELLEPDTGSVAAKQSARERALTPLTTRAAAQARRRRRGLTGVKRVRKMLKGRWYAFYRARWPIGGGRVRSVTFAVRRYGEKGARDKAVEARRQGLALLPESPR